MNFEASKKLYPKIYEEDNEPIDDCNTKGQFQIAKIENVIDGRSIQKNAEIAIQEFNMAETKEKFPEKIMTKNRDIDSDFPFYNWCPNSNEFNLPYDQNRFFDFTYSIFFFFFITSVKFYICNQFGLASFCDLGGLQYWKQLNENSQKNEIVLVSDVNCEEKCDSIVNILITKILESNYYFIYTINTYLLIYYCIRNKVQGPILKFLIVAPFLNHFISHAVFFSMKSYAFMAGNILYVAEIFLIATLSKNYLKVYSANLLLMGYYTLVKFFFETIFPFMGVMDPELTLQMVPLLIFFFKLIVNILFKNPYFKRYHPNTIVIIMSFFIFFEYVYIGTLHTLINKAGIGSRSFWLTITQHFIMEFLTKIGFSKRIFDLISSKTSKMMKSRSTSKTDQKNKNSYPIPVKELYHGIKPELEIYSILIYFLLISCKYYDYCMTNLVDCLGNPIYSISIISNSHFLLVVVLLAESGFDYFLFYLIQKRWGDRFVKTINVNFRDSRERFFYICNLFGVTINFGLPGLYSMMWQPISTS